MKTTNQDPEQQMQEHGGATAWLVFHFFAALASVGRWWRIKRVCAWCQRCIGGNPFARRRTHGMCRHCQLRWLTGLEAPPTFNLNQKPNPK